MLYEYQREGLDLALAARAYLSSGVPVPAVVLGRAVSRCQEEARRLAEERARRTRGRDAAVHLEEEVHACAVAFLLAEGMRWEPSSAPLLPGIVEVSHSPLGYLPHRKNDVSRALAHRAGARAGWPDLDVRAVDGAGRPLAWLLELKVEGGSLSRDQRVRVGRLRAAGHAVRLVRGDVADVVRDVLEVLRLGDPWAEGRE